MRCLPSRDREQIESESVRISKVPVMEPVEKPKAGNPARSLRHLGDTDGRERLVEVQLRNANIHQYTGNTPE
jgi:hypothetical protein